MRTATGGGYPIAGEAFDLEVFQLAVLFASSRELARQSRKHRGIGSLRETFELSETARRLVAVAAMVRSALDACPSRRRARLNVHVGRLVRDISQPRKSVGPLTFREACNKLIHADDLVLLDLRASTSGHLRYEVIIDGQQGEQEWRAYLSILPFLDIAARVA